MRWGDGGEAGGPVFPSGADVRAAPLCSRHTPCADSASAAADGLQWERLERQREGRRPPTAHRARTDRLAEASEDASPLRFPANTYET
jgi:hypothetical protein